MVAKPRVSSATRSSTSKLPKEVPYIPVPPKESHKYGLWYVAAICVIGLLFAVSFVFEHATVMITPHTLPVSFDAADVFTAEKDTTNTGTISFTEMTLSGDESIKLPSTDSKTVSEPAHGIVVLYNTFSTSPYKLVKSSRVQSSNGRIYRLDTATSIPGYTKQGTTIIPGSVEAKVTADVGGEAGNSDPTDFTLPGLAGTAQATKIYGRSKSAFTGGISGQVYTIPKDAIISAGTTLSAKLKASLIQKAKAQVPSGYVFFEGATLFESGEVMGSEFSKEENVPVVLSGTLTVYLLKEDTLLRAIATKFASQYDGAPVSIPELGTITFVPSDTIHPGTDTKISFTMRGSGTLVWEINKDTIKTILAGKRKNDLQSLLEDTLSVERADVTLRPFWKRSFPVNPVRISIEVKK